VRPLEMTDDVVCADGSDYCPAVARHAEGSERPAYDRWFLLGEKRSEQLALWEIEQYGRDSFGEPDYVSIYGLRPRDWYARGVRVLGRTAVECTRDRLADLIGRDVAATARTAPGASGSVVVDLFAGSANTLYWIKRHAGARLGVGFELDDAVFALTRENLAILGLGIELIHESYDSGLSALAIPQDELVIVFVAPPWGRGLDELSGLDLRQTTPPIVDVIDHATAVFEGRRLLFATQVYETVNSDSFADVTGRFQWSALKVYDIDAPARNHGLLLGTRGWSVRAAP